VCKLQLNWQRKGKIERPAGSSAFRISRQSGGADRAVVQPCGHGRELLALEWLSRKYTAPRRMTERIAWHPNTQLDTLKIFKSENPLVAILSRQLPLSTPIQSPDNSQLLTIAD